MNTQAIDFSAAIRGVVTYATSQETIDRAMETRFESRKVVADFVREAHGMEWSTIRESVKAAIDSLAVGIVADKVGLLGVIKTCCEYSIMPTTLNADRLRKAKTWTTLEGKTIPNGYGKVHKKPGAGKKAPAPTATAPTATAPTATAPTATAPTATAPTATAPTATAPTATAPTATAPTATAPTATAPTATAPTATTPKTSSKATTPQKASEPVHPLTSNVSSSDAPIPPREHFKTLMVHLFKNETFRGEYCDILALMLDVEKATLTRCMVQAADEVKV